MEQVAYFSLFLQFKFGEKNQIFFVYIEENIKLNLMNLFLSTFLLLQCTYFPFELYFF